MEEVWVHVHLDALCQTELFHLGESNVVPDDFLSKVGSVERIDAIGSDNASLDRYMTFFVLAIGILTAEEAYFVNHLLYFVE